MIFRRMKSKLFLPRLAAALGLALLADPLSAATNPPNILFILADDLGYGEIGANGQKLIRTPNLDQLAKDGMRFTQHYSGNAVCAPSRCVFLTGKHPGHAAIRNNREIEPEGQEPLPAAEVTLAELLKKQGYTTAAMGKWGLGFIGSEGDPLKQGFDHFYGYNCQRKAHNFYPAYIYDDTRRVDLTNNPPITVPSKLPAGTDANAPASYAPYIGKTYVPDLVNAKALDFIRENQTKPFFLYYATTVPHLSLQVPPDSLAEYAGKLPDAPYVGGREYLPHLTPHAAYAAMVTRLDRDIGKLLALLKELKLADNTIIVFTSDNGPVYDRRGGTDSEFFKSAGEFRGHKGSLYEGGVRVPLLIRWPGKIKAGATSDQMTAFEDWVPTFLDLIGAQKTLPPGLDGTSFAPALVGGKQTPKEFVYREFPAYGGQQSLRFGDWKAVRQNITGGKKKGDPALGQLELYNLREDIGETNDVAAKHPEVVAQLQKIMRQQHERNTVFPFPALDAK